jgi:hypothetical protein
VNDGNGLAEALLGLPGFRVLEVTEAPEELVVTIETTADVVGCSACAVRARSPGPQAGRGARSGVLRAAGPAGVGEAAVAVP